MESITHKIDLTRINLNKNPFSIIDQIKNEIVSQIPEIKSVNCEKIRKKFPGGCFKTWSINYNGELNAGLEINLYHGPFFTATDAKIHFTRTFQPFRQKTILKDGLEMSEYDK